MTSLLSCCSCLPDVVAAVCVFAVDFSDVAPRDFFAAATITSCSGFVRGREISCALSHASQQTRSTRSRYRSSLTTRAVFASQYSQCDMMRSFGISSSSLTALSLPQPICMRSSKTKQVPSNKPFGYCWQ